MKSLTTVITSITFTGNWFGQDDRLNEQLSKREQKNRRTEEQENKRTKEGKNGIESWLTTGCLMTLPNVQSM
jgi:hypothetical protein